MSWKQYGISALNAAISGAATAFLGIGAGLTTKQVCIVSLGGATVSFFKWMLQHQLPGSLD